MSRFPWDPAADRDPRTDEAETLTLALGVTGYARSHAGLLALGDHVIKLPGRFTPEDLHRALRDFELLADTLRAHPEEMTQLLEAHATENAKAARAVAARLGISEKSLRPRAVE